MTDIIDQGEPMDRLEPTDAGEQTAAGEPTEGGERPTIRWGALVWSLLFGAVAGLTLWVLVDRDRRDGVGEWLLGLSPFEAALYGLVVLGVVLALFGFVGLIRRGERRRT